MAQRALGKQWTASEDEKLVEAVQAHGEDTESWKQIALAVPGRTNKACRKRWKHSLHPSIKKTSWEPEEDELLVALHGKHPGRWALIATHVPGRTDDACAKRYCEALDPNLKKNDWSPSEDDQLMDAFDRLGSSWTRVGEELGRSGLGCRNRWRLLERRKKATERKAAKGGGNAQASQKRKRAPSAGLADGAHEESVTEDESPGRIRRRRSSVIREASSSEPIRSRSPRESSMESGHGTVSLHHPAIHAIDPSIIGMALALNMGSDSTFMSSIDWDELFPYLHAELPNVFVEPPQVDGGQRYMEAVSSMLSDPATKLMLSSQDYERASGGRRGCQCHTGAGGCCSSAGPASNGQDRGSSTIPSFTASCCSTTSTPPSTLGSSRIPNTSDLVGSPGAQVAPGGCCTPAVGASSCCGGSGRRPEQALQSGQYLPTNPQATCTDVQNPYQPAIHDAEAAKIVLDYAASLLQRQQAPKSTTNTTSSNVQSAHSIGRQTDLHPSSMNGLSCQMPASQVLIGIIDKYQQQRSHPSSRTHSTRTQNVPLPPSQNSCCCDSEPSSSSISPPTPGRTTSALSPPPPPLPTNIAIGYQGLPTAACCTTESSSFAPAGREQLVVASVSGCQTNVPMTVDNLTRPPPSAQAPLAPMYTPVPPSQVLLYPNTRAPIPSAPAIQHITPSVYSGSCCGSRNPISPLPTHPSSQTTQPPPPPGLQKVTPPSPDNMASLLPFSSYLPGCGCGCAQGVEAGSCKCGCAGVCLCGSEVAMAENYEMAMGSGGPVGSGAAQQPRAVPTTAGVRGPAFASQGQTPVIFRTPPTTLKASSMSRVGSNLTTASTSFLPLSPGYSALPSYIPGCECGCASGAGATGGSCTCGCVGICLCGAGGDEVARSATSTSPPPLIVAQSRMSFPYASQTHSILPNVVPGCGCGCDEGVSEGACGCGCVGVCRCGEFARMLREQGLSGDRWSGSGTVASLESQHTGVMSSASDSGREEEDGMVFVMTRTSPPRPLSTSHADTLPGTLPAASDPTFVTQVIASQEEQPKRGSCCCSASKNDASIAETSRPDEDRMDLDPLQTDDVKLTTTTSSVAPASHTINTSPFISFAPTPSPVLAPPPPSAPRKPPPSIQTRLSSQIAAPVPAYACGHPKCWHEQLVEGTSSSAGDQVSPKATALFKTSGELLDHRRATHGVEDEAVGGGGGCGTGPQGIWLFRCALVGCEKGWKSINGIQYHLQLSKAHFQSALEESMRARSGTIGSSNGKASNTLDPEVSRLSGDDLSLGVVGQTSTKTPLVRDNVVPEAQSTRKPFACTVDGCLNTYKQAAGLKYHLQHGHPSTRPVQLSIIPPALSKMVHGSP